jgi:signal peptidase II
MSSGSGRAIWPVFLGLVVGIVAADQVSKAWLTSFLAPGASVAVADDWLRLVFSENRGGLFGLLQGSVLAFAALSMVVIGLIVAYHGRAGRDPYLSVTLGLLTGGAIGNLLDRLRYGYVVDFVDAGIGDVRWYTFNVADAAISASIVLLLLAAIWPTLRGASPPRAGGR